MKIHEIENALNIWHDRKFRLITLWCTADMPWKQQYARIIESYEAMIKTELDRYFEHRKKIEERERQAAHTFIPVSCFNFRCERKFRTMLLKDYKPGELKCDGCGRTITTKEEREIEETLMRNRIRPNDNRPI
jgi:hypothetical protein